MKVGLDIDGVLADFVSAFVETIEAETGLRIPVPPTSWDWHRHWLSDEQDARVWHHIEENAGFWCNIASDASVGPARWAQLADMEWGHDLYFLTYRPGRVAKWQTEHWLREHGLWNPTVLITEHKGRVAKALGLDCYIDDRPAYCLDVRRDSPETRVYLRQAPYNRAEELALIAADVTPVPDVITMLDREGL
ncbi:MAG: hypothetical protein PHR30_16615 [Gallionellaceae bacterium]|nr:hypothetical protein [Gallionellaceae bacterium]